MLECCLELLEKGLLVSLQDLGAAGLTSSAGEMASAGGVGIDIDVAAVPLREADMEPFEIMVSESQERMLAVVEPERVAEVRAICEKWQTGSAEIGVVTDTGAGPHLPRRASWSARCRSRRWSTAARSTTSSRPSRPSGSTATARRWRRAPTPRRRCWRCSPPPAIASKRWVFEQYDSVVGSRTVRRPESADAAVLQLPEAGNAIAVSIDGNGRRVACDPHAGTVEAVLECAQNLACVGAEPLGLTNCLNFGNPEKPTPAWQLDRAVSGLADACNALGVPVVGGNVSLYNEGPDGPIYPTPVVAMVGELPDPAPRRSAPPSPRAGDAIGLLGPFEPNLAGSELAKQRGELERRPARARRRRRRRRLRDASARRSAPAALASAHDVSDGGLACALAESAIGGGVGCRGRPAAAARARLLARGGALRRGRRRLPAQRRARRAGGARRRRPRRGRRHHGRDRRRRPQPALRPRRAPRPPLALAAPKPSPERRAAADVVPLSVCRPGRD